MLHGTSNCFTNTLNFQTNWLPSLILISVPWSLILKSLRKTANQATRLSLVLFLAQLHVWKKLTDVESYNLKLWFIPVLKQLNVELKAWIVEWHTKNIINYNFMDLFKGHNQYLCFYLHLTWKINAIPFIYQLMTISIILIHHTFFKD